MSIKNLQKFLNLCLGQDRFYSDRNYKENVQLLKKFENIFRNEAKWRVLRLQYPLPALSVVYLPTKNRCGYLKIVPKWLHSQTLNIYRRFERY